MNNARSIRALVSLGLALASAAAFAQTACPTGYRILSRHYDAALQKTWELRQDCLHPDWPAHSVAVTNTALLTGNAVSLQLATVANIQPLLVRAGEPVRLWSQDRSARIEVTGIAEQSAHLGERINVRITHQSDDNGLTIQHISGIVRGTDSVEIAQ
jgi:hypothetical protein